MTKLYMGLFSILFIVSSCGAIKKIAKRKAIKMAEKYIIEQGFTDKIINLADVEVDLSVLEKYLSIDKITELRHNLLNPNATFSKKVDKGWLIGFAFNESKIGQLLSAFGDGKGVFVSDDGKEIRLFKENITFDDK